MAGKKGATWARKPDPIKRFWAKVEKGPSCWIWTAGRDKDGYGKFWFRGKHSRAHIASYLIHVGEIPEGMLVCHDCDNPWCVRPDHLFLGTYQDNSDDMVAKGRSADRAGEKNGAAKLTLELIEEAHRMKAAGIPQVRIAEHMNVSTAAISMALNGKTWAQPN